MKRPAGVVASAIVLALVSLLQIVMAMGMVLAASIDQFKGLVGAQSAVPHSSTSLPFWMQGFMYGMGVFFLLLAAWGIATTIGVYRLRSWARYSTLIIGGCMAAFGLVSMLGTLLIIAVPLPTAPGLNATQAHSMETVARIGLVMVALFHAAVLAIGVWWLVYFNRKSVRAVFTGSAGELAESRRPLLISVYAVMSIFGTLVLAACAFIPIPAQFFGVSIVGWGKVALYLVLALLDLAIGIGLWRLAEWARRLALGFLAFGVLNVIVYLVRPSLLLQNAAEMQRAMGLAQPEMIPHLHNTIYTVMFGFSLLFMVAIAYMLHHYRARFAAQGEVPLETT